MAYARISRLETAAIRAALETPAIRNGEVRVGIRDPHLVIQQVDIPKVPDEEVDEIIKWAVKDLPNPVDQYVFDHHMLGALEGNGKIAYNAFALDKTFVKQREQEIHDLGVGQISVMEPDINALAVCVCANYDLQANDRYAIIDLGHTIGTFAVISTNGIWSVQDISIASGGALTKLLGESVKITTPDLLKSEHASDVIQYLTTASIAVQKSIDSYMIDHANEPITVARPISTFCNRIVKTRSKFQRVF
jgi:Tfp pilus assembly PilM family ATPase